MARTPGSKKHSNRSKKKKKNGGNLRKDVWFLINWLKPTITQRSYEVTTGSTQHTHTSTAWFTFNCVTPFFFFYPRCCQHFSGTNSPCDSDGDRPRQLTDKTYDINWRLRLIKLNIHRKPPLKKKHKNTNKLSSGGKVLRAMSFGVNQAKRSHREENSPYMLSARLRQNTHTHTQCSEGSTVGLFSQGRQWGKQILYMWEYSK